MKDVSERLRWKRLADRMRVIRLPALLLTHLPDVRYLCGFTGSNAALGVLVSERGMRARLFTDGRYRDQARHEVHGATVRIAKRSAMDEAVRWIASAGAARCGIDAAHTTLAAKAQMTRALQEARSSCRLRAFALIHTHL